MSRRNLLALAVIAVALGVALWFWWSASSTTPAPPSKPDVAKPASIDAATMDTADRAVSCDPKTQVPLPIVIDAHAHIFNAWDVPATEFVVQVLVRPSNPAVAGIVRGTAGTVVAMLRHEAVHPTKEIVDLRTRLGSKAAAVPVFDTEGQRRLRRRENLGPTAPRPTDEIVADMMKEIERKQTRNRTRIRDEDKEGLAQYLRGIVGSFTSARGVNAERLMLYFPSGPNLFVGATVDFSFPLGKPAQQASMEAQVEANALVSIKQEGKLLPFFGYDPFRDVLAKPEGQSLALAKRAVYEAGFVGIKLYPPMGFRPYLNYDTALDPDREAALQKIIDAAGRHGDLSVADLEHALDRRMMELYKWAGSEDVPILAHAGQSNGAGKVFDGMSAPSYWAAALDQIEREGWVAPRILLGHFGGMSDLDDTIASVWETQFLKLVEKRPNIFGDISCFDTRNPAVLDDYFDDLMRAYPPPSSRLWTSLVYGSDWHMLSDIMQDASGQLSHIKRCVRCRLREPDQVALFAGNAVEAFGLRNGRPARNRLDAFYSKAGIDPKWREMVDAIPQ